MLVSVFQRANGTIVKSHRTPSSDRVDALLEVFSHVFEGFFPLLFKFEKERFACFPKIHQQPFFVFSIHQGFNGDLICIGCLQDNAVGKVSVYMDSGDLGVQECFGNPFLTMGAVRAEEKENQEGQYPGQKKAPHRALFFTSACFWLQC